MKDLGVFEALAEKKGSDLTDVEKDDILEKIDIPTNQEGFYVDAFGMKISYNGAKTMKKQDTKLALTDVHKNEIYHCMNDFKYFRKHYCKVVNRTGITRPEPRPYQEDAEDAFLTGEDVVLFFPRQSGKCHSKDTIINIRNKKTGEIEKITAGDFHNRIKNGK